MLQILTRFAALLFILTGCGDIVVRPLPPAEKPLQPAEWLDLPDWLSSDLRPTFEAFRSSCTTLGKKELWKTPCAASRETPESLRTWFETQFRPWALVNPDGSRTGTITGYYEPILQGSRTRQPPYLTPVFAPPEDMIVVDLAELYPELKPMRLRGRIEGRRLIPYFSRAQWADLTEQESFRPAAPVLLWVDDPLDFFFMQIQGSGQVQLDDGTRIRLGYADQNGHPYRSIGQWLIKQGEMKTHEASMQNIKAWAQAHPQRLQELLNVNPSLIFFRELSAESVGQQGPQGALGLPLTPEHSLAIDPRHVTLGAPVFLSTTRPNDSEPLNRLMLAQDTGGAIKGVVRADFYWGSGSVAGELAGKMRQKGQMWVLMPRSWEPR